MLVFLLILLNDGTFCLKNLSIILIVMDLTVSVCYPSEITSEIIIGHNFCG